MALSSTKVFVLEVMGRHAGWIAAAAGLAQQAEQPLPLLILFPEVPLDQAVFLQRVRQSVATEGYCTVVVSEGSRDTQGNFLSAQGSQDAFGHTQLGGVAPVVADLIKQQLGYKCHWAVADYLQRAARHIAAKVDVEQSFAVGQAAVKIALAGENAVMPAIVRTSNIPYTWEIGTVALSDVANQEKKMPADFLSEDGFGISAKCRDYLQPLIVGEDYPPYEQGLPRYIRLKNQLLEKKLPTY